MLDQPNLSESNEINILKYDFNDIKLKIGDRLHIKPSAMAKAQCCLKNDDHCSAIVIGYVPDKTLLVYLPKAEPLIGYPLVGGDQIFVRFFNGQNIFSFKVFVEKIINLPFKYIHLSFPTQIHGQAIRNSVRIKTNIEAKVTVNHETFPATITNLSSTGAEIQIRADLGEPGSSLNLSFDVSILEKITIFSVSAIIKRFNVSKNEIGQLIYGLKFIDVKPEQTQILLNYIYHELIFGNGKII
ncbi:MAG: flagellar brake protein [Nitrosomonas sp.]|nr:flagellar brake protein [Nitrosomonas sp.]